MLRYFAAILLGAFLLFMVQPLVGRLLLPSFGGLAIVWTTSVLVFQALLLVGYGWSHLLRRCLSPRAGLVLHAALVAASAFTLPLAIQGNHDVEREGSVSLQVAWMLFLSVGPAFLALSSTSPLIQAWQSATHPNRSPYRLYALSNIGSLAGLLLYPVVVESWFGLAEQARLWSGAFVIYALSLVWAGGQTWRLTAWPTNGLENSDPKSNPGINNTISPMSMVWWVVLTAIASSLMMATSTVLSQEVASFPFLWVLPLAAYLSTWIVAFDRPGWYRQKLTYGMLILFGVAGLILIMLGTDVSIVVHMFVMTGVCFWGALLCHGELERSKPSTEHLTFFWMTTSLGGLLGGALVVLAAPRLLSGFYEFHLAIAAAVMVGYSAVVTRAGSGRLDWQKGIWAFAGLILLAMLGASFFQTSAIARQQGMQHLSRTDYGLMSVWETSEFRYIQSGQTMHGRQFFDERRYDAVDYYAADRAVGLAMIAARSRALVDPDRAGGEKPGGIRIGVIGLGSGCLSAWAREGDRIRFYELNPVVVDIAWKWFGWLPRAREIHALEEPVVVGDARVQLALELKKNGSHQFDILVVDAFTSDSIPVHLLTRECQTLYWKHLRPDGILAIHISNRSLDLRPVLRKPQVDGDLESLLFQHEATDENPYGCTWVLMGQKRLLAETGLASKSTAWPDTIQSVQWTDDFNCVMWLVNWKPEIDFQGLAKRKKMTLRARGNGNQDARSKD